MSLEVPAELSLNMLSSLDDLAADHRSVGLAGGDLRSGREDATSIDVLGKHSDVVIAGVSRHRTGFP